MFLVNSQKQFSFVPHSLVRKELNFDKAKSYAKSGAYFVYV